MNLRLVLSLAAALLAGCPSLAARAEGVDPAALQLSRQLLDTMHISTLADQMTNQMIAAMGAGLNAANPGKAKEVQDVLTEVLVPEMKQLKPDLLDGAANIYAANFSAAELKQILAFYQSDIGQKMVERQPTILAEQGQVAQAVVRKAMPDIQDKVLKALEARGLNKPKGA